MNRCYVLAVVLLTALVLAASGAALAAGETRGNEGRYTARESAPPPPSGRVELEFGQGALIVSALGGNGTLTYNGKQYPFKLGGLGIGAIGASSSTAEGTVYNLQRLEDFDGTYLQLEGGYAAIRGEGVLWLRNTRGVEIELRSKTKGAMLQIGAEGVVVQFSDGR